MTRLDIDTFAEVAGITTARALRVLATVQQAPGTPWRKAHLDVQGDGWDRTVAVASLPVELREAVIMRDQLPLPLSPPRTAIRWTEPPR